MSWKPFDNSNNPVFQQPARAGELIAPCDREAVHRFNALAAPSQQLQTDLVPLPYFGNPNAPVVLLQSNPGFNSERDRINQKRAKYIKVARANLRHEALTHPFFLLDDQLELEPGQALEEAAGHNY